MSAQKDNNFKGRKVLVFGLGLLGGGVATTNWLLKQGAKVTVTDLKDKKALAVSLKKIKGRVRLALGGHKESDIRSHDVIVCNQDVSINSPYIQLAFKFRKEVETEGTLFYKLFPKRIVGVTGTRGKTTTTVWINEFLQTQYRSSTAGNWAEINPFLYVADLGSKLDIAVTEIPSFQLEYFHLVSRGPEVAVITNISPDHLNRHKTMKEYARSKSNLFKNQTPLQHLVLNADNQWTGFLLKQKPKAKVWFFSVRPLVKGREGVFYRNGKVFFQQNGQASAVLQVKDFVSKRGEHNLQNLMASSLATHLTGCEWKKIQKTIGFLPEIKFRQETVFKNKRLEVINDTTATSPEGAMAAVKRFGSPHTVLIAGGTDRMLDFKNWTGAVSECIKPENIILIQGSATKKMLNLLGKKVKPEQVKETLTECFELALSRAEGYKKALILFSPAAKSFEKFKNEYDRGKKFNRLVKKLLK